MPYSDLLGSEAPVEAVDIDFHGDIRLLAEGGAGEYIARFTHGTLEWVRPKADLPASYSMR